MTSRPRKEIQLTLPQPKRPPATVLPTPVSSWEVRARAHQSFLSQIPFEEGDVICSRLVRYPEGIAREDYRKEEWNGELAKSAMFYWKTKYRKPAPKKEPPFKEENAEELLQELLERNDPATENTVYILALMLERKRIFIERGSLQDADGHFIRLYEKKDGEETYMIRDPRLTLDQISAVQQEVALELGWIKPPEEVSAVEEAGEGEPEDASEKNSQEEVDNPRVDRL